MTIRRLPPLNAIKAFEAAARHGSFTRAAVELCVTHGAVSRQIRALEEWLGVQLLVRTSRNASAPPRRSRSSHALTFRDAARRLAAVAGGQRNNGSRAGA